MAESTPEVSPPPGAVPSAAAASSAVSPRLRAGSMLGHYHLLRRLAVGGMGEIYLADDARLGRRVAIKILSPALAGDPRQVSRFHHEALVAASLNDPHILTVHDLGRADGLPYFVTEFVDGQTLRESLGGGPLAPAAAAAVAAQVAAALAVVHRAGLVHQDVKPENLIQRRDGLVKLIDFGICARVEAPRAREATPSSGPGEGILGTLEYLSPERAQGLRVDARSDLFSLGVVLYEMLTGQLPFPGTSASERLEALRRCEPRPPSWLVAGIDEELVAVVMWLLDSDPARRPPHAEGLSRELESLARTSRRGSVADTSPRATSALPPEPRPTVPMRRPPAAVPQRSFWPLGSSRRHRVEESTSSPGTDPVLRAAGRVVR